MKRFLSLTVLLMLGSLLSYAQHRNLTLHTIFETASLRAKGVPGFRSMSDGTHYSELDPKGDLVLRSFATGAATDTLVKAGTLKTADGKVLPLDGYRFSTNENSLLIETDRKPIYRRSYLAMAYVYNLKTRQLYPVADTPVMHADFSPDGSKVAYVSDNNLFVKDLSTGQLTQVTHDGRRNHIINGNCDWVYEEEFEFTRAFDWSPDGDRIAYYRFDESQVPEYTIPFYRGVYPTMYTYKYPKAGEPNSLISIHVYDLKDGSNRSMDLGPVTDQYIPRIKWTQDDNTLCVYRMNRLQDTLQYLLADVRSGSTHVMLTQTDKWYIDEAFLDDLHFLKNGREFILLTEEDGWQHVYLYNMEGRLLHKITTGAYDVASIDGIDETHRLLYYTAANLDPMDRELLVSRFDGTGTRQLTQGAGWHEVSFSADNSYFLDAYSTLTHPPVYTLYDRDGHQVRRLEDNHLLIHTLDSFNLSTPQFITVKDREGVSLNGWMLKPPHFDPHKKYPVLFMNYGGPGSQTVTNRWGTVNEWQQLLAEHGYVIVSVDNRGTGFRGVAFKKETYLQLGWLEIHDQMDAARYLLHHYSWVDSSRIGHWGWSFGGFMSSLAITVGSNVFHTAVAVAPVTSWRYYDNIYTERYMRTPQTNAAGYDKTSPISYADRLKGKFLIIHGTGDDNVHFQNSVMFSEALIQDKKQFQQAYYPNNNHGIYGGNTSIQLYTRMTDFILHNL